MAGTPTVRKRLLGVELRLLRDKAGLKQEAAAKLIGTDGSGISKIEAGQAVISLGNLEKLLRHYGIAEDSDEWTLCLDWRAGARQPRNYWSGYRAVISEGFRTFVELESDCELLQATWSEMVPDWLQDEPYMRAAFSPQTSRSDDNDTVDHAVAARQARQGVFLRDDSPELHIVMSESCLVREFGPAEMMYQTLGHIIELSERRNFKIQIIPLAYKPGRTQAAAFAWSTSFRIPSKGLAGPLRYSCLHLGNQYQYTDDPTAVDHQADQFGTLSAIALDFVDSRELMVTLLRRYAR